MGWVSSVPGSFGECLTECIEQIVEDEGILLREGFRKILAKSARDWRSIAGSLNGGNERCHNLCRMGSKIDEIAEHCRRPVHRRSGEINESIDWNLILEDVKSISKVVLHEMQKNLVSIHPNGIRDLDKNREYSTYFSVDSERKVV